MAANKAVKKEVATKENPSEFRKDALCRQLSRIKVGRIMSFSAVSVPPDFSVGEAKAVMQRHRVCAAPVVDGAGRILGIVTLAEINRLIAALTGLGQVGSIRTENPTP